MFCLKEVTMFSALYCLKNNVLSLWEKELLELETLFMLANAVFYQYTVPPYRFFLMGKSPIFKNFFLNLRTKPASF